MGIELYIQGYNDTGADGLSKDRVLDMFGLRGVEPDQFGFFPMVYDGEPQCHVTLKSEGEAVTTICIRRPTHHVQLWQSLFTLLTAGPYVLFAPGGACPLIGQERVRAWLPPDMVESLGEPLTVTDAAKMQSTLFPQDA